MADKKYAGENGLSAIFAQIKAAIAGKADIGLINSISEDVGELQDDVTGLQNNLTDYVKIGIAYLAEDTTVQTGFFDLQFAVPTFDGYKPIGVTTYNFADRGIADKVNISGIDRSSSIVHIYGSVSQQVTFRTSAYVCVLYIRV